MTTREQKMDKTVGWIRMAKDCLLVAKETAEEFEDEIVEAWQELDQIQYIVEAMTEQK